MAHVLNIASEAEKPMSELIAPLRRYFASGEMDFEAEDKRSKIDELARRYSDGQVDHLDGVAVTYKDWWFNARPSNTEPLLRLNVEAKTEELLREKLAELEMQLGKPV
jgi:phosphomannomutase